MDVSKALDCAHVEENDLVSRYLARKLSPEEAEAFEEHYFGCDRCWAEVQAATEVRAAVDEGPREARATVPEPEPSRVVRGPWRTWAPLAAAAAVAFAVVAGLLLARRPSRSADPGALVADLAEAVGQGHTIHARLTGGFKYPSVSRSAGGSNKAASWKVFAEAEKIKVAAERNVTAESARALGLAHLFVGEVDQAVARLEEAVLLDPKDARIHSDISAAYLVLGQQKERSDAFVRALSEAETAIQLQPDLAEAHFNRALALEAMSLKSKAKEAWEAYLRIDSKSEWADEARRHLEALSKPRTSRNWDDELKRLLIAVEQADSAVVQDVLKYFPQQSREHFEQHLLPEWAVASAAKAPVEAARLLRNLNLLAREQSQATGDRMLPDVADAVSRVVESGNPDALARLTRGLIHYSRGKDLLDRLESQKAQIEFDEARLDLNQSRNPLSAWADFYRAICLYYKDDFERSRMECERLRVFAEKRGYSNLLGRASWMTGLVLIVRGQVDQAVTDYSFALKCFTATGEKGHVAAVESLIATGLAYLGDSRASWRHRLASLHDVEDLHDSRRAHRLYSTAADAAMSESLPLVALVFQDEALRTAPSWNSPLILMEGHLYRAAILGRLQREQEVAYELARAREFLAEIRDEPIKVGELAALNAATGELEAGKHPQEAQELLSRAIEYFVGTEHRVRLPVIYLARGRAFLSSGNPDRAEADFIRGIKEFELQRDLQGQFRASFFEGSRELFQEVIRLEAFTRTSPEAALGYADRLRAGESETRSLKQSSLPARERILDAAALRSHLPQSTVLLYFASLTDRLLSWLVTPDGIKFSHAAIPSSEIDRRVALYRTALEMKAAPRELEERGGRFYEDLIRPHARFLPESAVLLVVPDGALHELPFAGLYDRDRKRYLIQDHAIALVLSAKDLMKAGQSTPHGPATVNLTALAVGNPEFDENSFPGLVSLPYAAAEAQRVAEIYPGSELLVGTAATRDELLDAVSRHNIFHFAGHALSNPDYPEFARLVLAREYSGGSESLFAKDIAAQRLSNVRLVVLAACRSAQTGLSRAEGPISLARPFLAAGIPQVIGTLWDIDDRYSSSFFVRFHTALSRGTSAMNALREAQLYDLGSPNPTVRSPANWAAYVLFGTDQKVHKGV